MTRSTTCEIRSNALTCTKEGSCENENAGSAEDIPSLEDSVVSPPDHVVPHEKGIPGLRSRCSEPWELDPEMNLKQMT